MNNIKEQIATIIRNSRGCGDQCKEFDCSSCDDMANDLIENKRLVKAIKKEILEDFVKTFLERLPNIRIERDIHDEEEADLDIDDVWELVEKIKREKLKK
jgi:uncharacterized protein (UPF0305 family)